MALRLHLPGTVRGPALDGAAAIQPAYVLSLVPEVAQAVSDHHVELLDSAGGVVSSHSVTVYEAEEQGIVARSIHANVPLPVEAVASLRLVRGEQTVAERALGRYAAGLLDTPQVEQTEDF